MKKIVYTTMVALLLVACSKESDDTGSGTGGGGESGGVTEVTPVTSDSVLLGLGLLRQPIIPVIWWMYTVQKRMEQRLFLVLLP